MPSALQNANAAQQRVGRTPQTTAQPAGGPFNRQTRRSRIFGSQAIGQDFGELIAGPLKPVPGFLQGLDITVAATGGSAGKATVAVADDAPYSVIANVQLIDAFGNPIASYSGFELALLQVYSGQCGFWKPLTGGVYDPVVDSDGNFSFHVFLPLELFDGYCSIAMQNAAAVPNLRIQLAPASQVYGTPPDTLPDIAVTVEQPYNSVGLTNPNAEPPDNGASHQWFSQPGSQLVGSAGMVDVQMPPLGGWLTVLILEGRDALGVRSDDVLAAGLDTQTALWIDNVPEFQELFGTRKDWMNQFYTIPDANDAGADMLEGILVYPYRDAAATFGPVSAIDTADSWVDTNPGTQVQFKSTSGTISNAPGTIVCLSGRVYTPGGVPYTHLAD